MIYLELYPHEESEIPEFKNILGGLGVDFSIDSFFQMGQYDIVQAERFFIRLPSLYYGKSKSLNEKLKRALIMFREQRLMCQIFQENKRIDLELQEEIRSITSL